MLNRNFTLDRMRYRLRHPFWVPTSALEVPTHKVASGDLLISLQNVVKVTNKVLLVMTPWSNPRPLGRVWCLWEILQAVKLKATIRMILPSKEQDAFMLALQTKYGDVEKHWQVLMYVVFKRGVPLSHAFTPECQLCITHSCRVLQYLMTDTTLEHRYITQTLR